MLQVASGCAHNACRFCDMYHAPFTVSPRSEVEADVRELAGACCPAPRVFLTGGNAFALPADALLDIAALVREALPRTHSIGCFARVDDVAAKSDDELAALAAAGFDMLSIGAESGLDEALARMNKGFRVADTLEQSARLARAKIRFAFFYLAGIAGHGRGLDNARASAEAFGQAAPAIVMVHTMTPFPGTPLAADIEAGAFPQAGEVEIMEELREFYACYPARTRMLAAHVGNTVTFDAYVPDKRDAILALMDERIARADEGRLAAFRRCMRSI